MLRISPAFGAERLLVEPKSASFINRHDVQSRKLLGRKGSQQFVKWIFLTCGALKVHYVVLGKKL